MGQGAFKAVPDPERSDAGAHDLLSEGNELLFDRKFLLSEGNELGSEVRFWQLRPNELVSHA